MGTVNVDHPLCKLPRKALKTCPGRDGAFSGALSGPYALSPLDRGHVSLFLHRISVVRVYLSIAATAQDPAGQDPHHLSIVHPSAARICIFKMKATICHFLNLKHPIASQQVQMNPK